MQAADLFADTQAVQEFCSVLAHRMFHTTGRGHESIQYSTTSAGDPSGATGNLSSQKLENGQVCLLLQRQLGRALIAMEKWKKADNVLRALKWYSPPNAAPFVQTYFCTRWLQS